MPITENIGNLGKLKDAVTLKRSILTAKPDIEGRDFYPLLAEVGSDGCRGCPSSGRSVPQLCYYKHHRWMVTVVVTLPDILPCVLRAGMGPLGKGSSSPEFWRNIQRYWILRRICRSINC
jgi:hypothetical protein